MHIFVPTPGSVDCDYLMYVLKIDFLCLFLFLFFKISPVINHSCFTTVFFFKYKNFISILVGIAMNQWISSVSMDISIHEYGRFPIVLNGFFCLFHVLEFSLEKYFLSMATFISRHKWLCHTCTVSMWENIQKNRVSGKKSVLCYACKSNGSLCTFVKI